MGGHPMNRKPVLVVMAAGMGSRYGGLKQIDPVGSHGEAILDYSLFDAHEAGFETAVIIIKKARAGEAARRHCDPRRPRQALGHLPCGAVCPGGH